MSERERNALMDACFAYDDVLRKNGNFVGGEALQSARNATTLRWKKRPQRLSWTTAKTSVSMSWQGSDSALTSISVLGGGRPFQ
jgi:hypothetical protein